MSKEAKARIKINKLLEGSGWRFFDDEKGKANIAVESNAKIAQIKTDSFGEDFEATKNGFIDFLLLDDNGFPFVVLEAKKEDKNPLDGKEQARSYAQSQNIRFVILSNGNVHYFWDIDFGNPVVITEFPTLASLKSKSTFTPNHTKLSDIKVDEYFIATTQKATLFDEPMFLDETTKKDFIIENGLRLLRPYQIRAIQALQKNGKDGNDRFLFEMATGTGKTLTSAAVIKLFLRTGNAKRVLFLVDRLELENQAYKNFVAYLKNDYTTAIYKQNKDDWKKAEIVVTTVQSLLFGDKYKKLFSPTDFDLLIADESHRAINGNARAVFEYFVGFKLGLTATPKDYLKNTTSDDEREWERRVLLDTYKTFGCDSAEPTFRYSLIDGVRDGYLINPIVADARTDITAQLLSEKGYAVHQLNENGEEDEDTFVGKDFEKTFFSENTNIAFCKTFIENGLKDPISGEIGKTIIFCVSQKHASKITQILNEMAHATYPDKYNSDFAVQITSNVPNAQMMTINFANNNLSGYTKFLEGYKSSKTRVAVTVGMMTTGYDCEDILNLCLMRPIFSPADFVQIKGRGTRKHTFVYKDRRGEIIKQEKQRFKFFDFFANCEYFEEKFDYDEVLKIPKITTNNGQNGETPRPIDTVEITSNDIVKILTETPIGIDGMKIDRKLFALAKEAIAQDEEIKTAVFNDQWELAIATLREKYEDQPNLFLNLDKIRKSENLDRRVSWREVLERVFGLIDRFETKDEKLETEVEKFISIYKPDPKYVPHIRNYMKAYIGDEHFRTIINDKEYGELNTYAGFGMSEFKSLNGYRDEVPNYIKNYIPLNQFMQ